MNRIGFFQAHGSSTLFEVLLSLSCVRIEELLLLCFMKRHSSFVKLLLFLLFSSFLLHFLLLLLLLYNLLDFFVPFQFLLVQVRIFYVLGNNGLAFFYIRLVVIKDRLSLLFFHCVLVFQLRLYFFDSLNIRIWYFAVFCTVTVLNVIAPLDTVEFEEKFYNVCWVQQVYKSESNSFHGAHVLGQVEIVELAVKLSIDNFQQSLLVELDWHILNHKGSLLEFILVV